MEIVIPAVLEGLSLPSGVTAHVFDYGRGEPDFDPSRIEVYVPSYLGGTAALEIVKDMTGLRLLQLLTAGADHAFPLLPPNVTLCNARGVHDAPTAELAIGLTLASLRGLQPFIRAADLHLWRPMQMTSLADRVVLILGYGSIGKAIEARLLPFEVEIIRVAKGSREGVHSFEELPALLGQADVVIVITPLTPETKEMVDEKFLSYMRDGALIVNVARGSVIKTSALLRELYSYRLHAALDVTDPEPLPSNYPLWDAPNCIITPHIGGDTSAFLPRGKKLVEENLRRYCSGEELLNVIDGGY